MNCQEVMELMQRQLDGDLNAQEEDELHAHLMHCLECARMFERLQLLSDELSQLPKVMPPFSLVDSILPQLNDIQLHADASIADSKPTAPESSSLGLRTEHVRTKTRGRRFGSHISWRLAGGVVAAGLIIGFFAFQNNGSTDQADGLLQPRAKSNMPSTASQEQPAAGIALRKTDPGAAAADASSVQQEVGGASPAGADAAIPQASPAAKPPNDLNVIDQFAEPRAIGDSTTAASSSSPKTDPVKAQTLPTPAPASHQDDAKAVQTASPTEGAPQSQENKAPSVPPQDENQEAAGDASPSPAATLQAPKKKSEEPMGIRSFTLTAPEPLRSASGLYEAVVENGQVVVKDASTHEPVFATNHEWQQSDEIVLVEWSADDKLTYRVVSGETEQTLVIDMAAKKEIKP